MFLYVIYSAYIEIYIVMILLFVLQTKTRTDKLGQPYMKLD